MKIEFKISVDITPTNDEDKEDIKHIHENIDKAIRNFCFCFPKVSVEYMKN